PSRPPPGDISLVSLLSPVLTQPPSLSASPGASARLTCTLSSGYIVGGYHIFWYQQKPGSSPRYLLRFKSDSDKHQGSGVPSRFSGSKEASANSGLLLISALQPEDEADYYCATVHSNTGTYRVLLMFAQTKLPCSEIKISKWGLPWWCSG
uniref:Immunoglobulin lambda variable 5-52 n=1 Tax=Phocoena sinus TaxID=42100 RepID=A0A8C9CVI8_PHOSS